MERTALMNNKDEKRSIFINNGLTCSYDGWTTNSDLLVTSLSLILTQVLVLDMDYMALVRYGIAGRPRSRWFRAFKKTIRLAWTKTALTDNSVMIFVLAWTAWCYTDRRNMAVYDESFDKLSSFFLPRRLDCGIPWILLESSSILVFRRKWCRIWSFGC